MAAFRLRFHACDGSVAENTGVDGTASLADARAAAMAWAREIMAQEVREGRLCLSCWIVISDDRGDNLLTVQFGEALAIQGGAGHGHLPPPPG